MEKTKRGLAPVIGDAPEVLILGSLPGDISIQKQQYYASPRNQFWRILSGVFDSPVGSTYADRVEFVLTHKLALWDVLKSADREGSLDSSIRKAVPNDFVAFFSAYSEISTIALNGGEASRKFRSVCGSFPEILADRRCIELPSTSGVPGKNVLGLSEKIQRWGVIRVAEQSHAGDARNACA